MGIKMMYLIELMNARHMSRIDLSDLSGVPESTLRDILTGNAQLDRCEAATLYSIAEALDVSIEDILLSYWDELEEANAPDTFAVHEEGTLMPFYLLVDATLSKLHKEVIWPLLDTFVQTNGLNSFGMAGCIGQRCSCSA